MESPSAYELSRWVRTGMRRPNRIMAPFKYYGGKGMLARRILMYLPRSRIYVEPFCGAASVLFHKEPWPVEVINDINEEIINVFRVLQDKGLFEELAHRLTWTPYSRSEFVRAIRMESQDPVDRAWATIVRCAQGFAGKPGKSFGDWARVGVSDNVSGPGIWWSSRIAMLDWWHARLRNVQIDCTDGIECIQYWDNADTTFYVDPPYVMSTRRAGEAYGHEVDEDYHRKLIETLLRIKGQAVVSGHEHEIYKPLEDAGWTVVKIDTVCHAAGRVRGSGLRGDGSGRKKVPRTEVLWIKRRDELFSLPGIREAWPGDGESECV